MNRSSSVPEIKDDDDDDLVAAALELSNELLKCPPVDLPDGL